MFLCASIIFASKSGYQINKVNTDNRNQIIKEDAIIFNEISQTVETEEETSDFKIIEEKEAAAPAAVLPSEWILQQDDYRAIGINEEDFPVATEEQKLKLEEERRRVETSRPITLDTENDDFYFSSSSLLVSPESDYHGTIIHLSEEDKNMIVHMLCHEFGADYGGCLLVAQVMRDAMLYNSTMPHNEYGYVDVKNMLDTCFSPHYSSDYHDCAQIPAMGGTPDISLAAYDYIFEQGKSAIQHKILCYASPDIVFQFNPNLYRVIMYTSPNGIWKGLFWSWL